jgi:long-chain fatty acid transport protein
MRIISTRNGLPTGLLLVTLAPAWLVLIPAASALAGGFSIYEAGAKATGMGCAVTASVDDGSALFYNIAALSFIPGTVADLNLIPVMPRSKYRQASPPDEAATGELKHRTFPIPAFGITHNPGGKFAYGVALYAPFGLGIAWQDPETWIGRFSSYDVGLETVYVTPAVSYKLTDNLALGLGVDIAWQHLELNRYNGQAFGGQNELVNVVDANLEGASKLNVTPAVGVMYRPDARWFFGAMYHHRKTMKYEDQDGRLTNVAPDVLREAVDATLDALAGVPGQRTYALATELNLPHMLSLGVAHRVHERLLVELNAVHFGWSRFDEIELRFDPDPTGSLTSVIPEHYADRWQWRLGLDFDLTASVKLLAGYTRDNTPQPKESMGPLLPDADRNDWSFGVQYRTGPWRLTASYMAVLNESRNNLVDGEPAIFPEERDDPQAVMLRTMEAGAYEGLAHILAFGVGRHF